MQNELKSLKWIQVYRFDLNGIRFTGYEGYKGYGFSIICLIFNGICL